MTLGRVRSPHQDGQEDETDESKTVMRHGSYLPRSHAPQDTVKHDFSYRLQVALPT